MLKYPSAKVTAIDYSEVSVNKWFPYRHDRYAKDQKCLDRLGCANYNSVRLVIANGSNELQTRKKEDGEMSWSKVGFFALGTLFGSAGINE